MLEEYQLTAKRTLSAGTKLNVLQVSNPGDKGLRQVPLKVLPTRVLWKSRISILSRIMMMPLLF